MSQTKTLHERQKELQALLADAAGRQKLQELETLCFAESGKVKPARASVITYILVHERAQGQISG